MSARAVVRYELTALGRAALEEDAEDDADDSAPCCAWCEEAILEGEAVVPAGAGRPVHDSVCCRGAFESFISFIAAEDAEEASHAET